MKAVRFSLAVFAIVTLGVFCFALAPAGAIQNARQSGKPRHVRVPEDPFAELLGQGQAALDRKDFEGAAKIFSDYLSKNPDNAFAHFQLGYAWTALGKRVDAAGEYRRASELDPTMAAAFLNLGLTLLDAQPADAIPPLKKAAELQPDEPRAKLALGLALERTGDAAAAIEQFKAATALDAKNLEIRMEVARALLNAQRGAEAEQEYRAATELQPGFAAAHLGLAESLALQKKMEAAAAELGTYLQLQPQNADARVQRASILAGLGKNDEALAELDRAAAYGPETVTALKMRSLVYFQQKNYTAALGTLQKAAAAAPNDLEIQARIGHLLIEEKKYPEAVHVLGAAFRANPQDNEVLRDLTTAQYLAGNYQAALEAIDLLDKRETLPPGAWFVRATCYDRLGEAEQALGAYRKFLELNAGKENDEYFKSAARARALERELKDKKH